MFDMQDVDDNLLIIDSNELTINQWLEIKSNSAIEKTGEGLPTPQNQ
jgi:hypothetical protein